MRHDLERYQPCQVYLLNNGQFICINSIDEMTKMNTSEKSRKVRYSKGFPHKKGDEFHSEYSLVIENDIAGNAVTFFIDKTGSMAIEDMRKYEAAYIGTLNDTVAKKYRSILGRYYDSM